MKTFNEAAYDVIAKSHKNEVIFEGGTEKGSAWIRRNWLSDTFRTENLLNASAHVRKMNSDGVSVVLFCGV